MRVKMENNPAKKRILISAYACSPYKGSEPGVGWGFVSELSKNFEIDVIVEKEKFQKEIIFWLNENSESTVARNVTFHFIQKRRNRKLRKFWPPSYYYFYRSWHREAMQLAAKLVVKKDISLCHQLTMVGYREPGYLWQLPVPFVWGPIGGAGFFPIRFAAEIGIMSTIYYIGYNIYNYTQMRLSKRVRSAAKKADAALICATSENSDMARKYWGADAIQLTEVGIKKESLGLMQPRPQQTPLKVVWSGLIIPRKGLSLALKTLSNLSDDVCIELHILGDGPQRIEAEKLARNLGVESRCIFHGWLPRENCEKLLQEMHVSLITSLRDLTSTVAIEALQYALPVIAPKHCGFTDVINSDCGILCDVDNPSVFTKQLADAIRLMFEDESYRQKLSIGASRQITKYTWEAKVEMLRDVYGKKLEQSS